MLGCEGKLIRRGRDRLIGRGFTLVRDGHLGGFSIHSRRIPTLCAGLPLILGEQI